MLRLHALKAPFALLPFALVTCTGLACIGCRSERPHENDSAATSLSAKSAPTAASASAAASAPAASASPTRAAALACPEGMALLPGGEFWVGSKPKEGFSPDESPRFLTRLAPFCLDVTEVTTAAYLACVEREACTKSEKHSVLCNSRHPERGEHPMNCVTFAQAENYCAKRGARLPNEVEWEFAARGGPELRAYPWGDGAPDGRTCWKQPTTCKVKSYAPGAFGLYDISGNVWEWTDSWYGPYPWSPEHGFAKVYRGGSFSRRFEKWMHTRLRDRARPDDAGAHLGFRCALTPEGAECPFGRNDDGRCRHGVLGRDCPAGETWNGVRCAAPGAPRCRAGRHEKAGFGCVLDHEIQAATRDLEAEAKSVTRARSPEFDADCQQNQPRRPHAYRYSGSSHEARNLVSRRAGCKNRDVGVGWNSTCCP